ncbi:PH domain-containing protein [Bacillus sp. DX4.1]|uniref:PH domain-containing protein n=1 Tax=Bacillus sp. DX4.1 TaxID=3055867 RepID=UPI0025A2B5A6|nr:PH domain-containing protein [Bacillus sp. DX4.1]MDM5187397.1 PH domain-containing protein [Bacillus sp. DX4.1]
MYKRQHPITILLELKISHLLPGIIPLISLKGDFPFWYMIPIAIFVATILFAFINWYYKIYWVEDNVLHIKHGMFVKKESYLNKERVQTINTSSNVIYQLLGLTRLKIETAGGGNEPEVALAGIKEEEAKDLIALLNEGQSIKNEKQEESNNPTAETNATVYKLTIKEILLASVTSGQFGLLFSFLLVFAQELYEYIPKSILNPIEKYVKDSDVYGWVYMAVVLLFISWLISTISYALKHANFTVYRRGNEVRISQGLLEKKELVLKLHRIQAITIKEAILRQPFGYCSVHVEIIQSVEKDNMNVTLHPLMKKRDVQKLLEYLQLPYEMEENVTRLPKKAMRRYLIYSWIFFVILALPITGVSIYFKQYIGLFLLIPVFLFFTLLGYGKYITGGYALQRDQLTLVYRGIAKHTGLVKKRHVQSMTKSQTYFQRKDQLCTFMFAVACTGAGRHYELKHTRLEDVDRIHNWYKQRKNTLA